MNVVGWILSAILAVVYGGAGGTKLATPRQKLMKNPNMAWAADFTDSQVKGIAGLEVLGVLGVILPWLTGIAKVLTPIAAVGLALVAAGALVVHARRKEPKAFPINVVLLVVAVAVAVIRFSEL